MTVTLSDVRKAACLYYNIPPAVLIGHSRCRDVARPRQVAMKVCRDLTGKSLPAIAAKFGNLDHTTVMHAIAKLPDIAKSCQKTANALLAIPALAERTSADRMTQEREWVRLLHAGEISWPARGDGQ